MRLNYTIFLLLICLSFASIGNAQTNDSIPPTFDYSEPKQYEIGGIKVKGAQFSDANALIAVTGLKVGDQLKVPGNEIPKAIRALWKLRLFTDVQILKEKSVGEIIFIEIIVQERPRYIRHSFKGVKKSKHDDLNGIISRHLLKGNIVTENAKVNARTGIEGFYKEKGYLDVEVKVLELEDEKNINAVRLIFDVDKKDRVKIKDITFEGNTNIKSKKMRKLMKGTRRKRKIFASSKLIQQDYEQDKKNIVSYYNTIGFRDARIVKDSVWRRSDGDLQIHINVNEGNRYFFRNISWK
ncbi:MAG: POTRA domain-containing protein, partial [Bacteroidota bacterium]